MLSGREGYTQKKRLDWMPEHSHEKSFEVCVSYHGDESEEDEQQDIDTE